MRNRSVRWLSLVLSLAATTSAGAQGFGLNDVGTCAVGRGYAVTGAPCMDASVIYWNPAATAALPKGWSILAGVTPIKIVGSFTQDTTGTEFPGDVPIQWPPHAFVSYGRGRVAFGVGAYVPYGLTSQWKPDFPGRFSAQKASLASLYVQPNVAVQLAPNWSIGGGPVFAHSTVELRQSIDLSQQVTPCGQALCPTFGQIGIAAGTEFARAKLKGNANAWGFNLGLYGKILPTLSIGAHYLSKVTFKYDNADATFEQVNTGLVLAANGPITNPLNGQPFPGNTPLDPLLTVSVFNGSGPLQAQKGSTTLVHPWQLQFGLGFTGIARTTLSFDLMRAGWKDFQRIPLIFSGPAAASSDTLLEDYKNNWAMRVGAEYALSNGWALRGGYSHATTPVPDQTVTPLLPDMNRDNFSAGLGVPLIANKLTVDAGYLYVGTPGRRGRIVERTDPSLTAADLNSGWYQLHAHVFAVSLKANF